MVLWKRKEVIYGKPRDKYSLRKSEPPHLPWCRRIRYTTDKIGIIRGQLRICRYARGKCSNPEEKAVHFFLDDYQFDTLWRNPDRYVDKLSKFRYILTPDFSTYTDFPKVIQIYNHYRKHWIGAYLQEDSIWLPCDSNNLMEHTGFLRLVFRWGAKGWNSCSIFCWLYEWKEKERTVSFWLRCHD